MTDRCAAQPFVGLVNVLNCYPDLLDEDRPVNIRYPVLPPLVDGVRGNRLLSALRCLRDHIDPAGALDELTDADVHDASSYGSKFHFSSTIFQSGRKTLPE